MSYVTVLKLLKQGAFHLACGLFLLAMVPLGYAQQQSALKVSLSLPQATMDVAYSGSMNITGGAGPYSITESGTLPAGLAWHNGANGSLLTGTPTAAGTFNLTVIVTDTIGEKLVQTGALVVGTLRPKPLDAGATQSVTDLIVVADGATANAAPTVTPSTIPGGKAGESYGPVFFTNLDTTTPVVFVLQGALPQGMLATPGTNTLELSGTPIVSGSFPIQVQIFDLPYLLHTTITSYTLSIAAPQPLQITVSSSFNDAPYVGTAIVPATFFASGGSGNLSLSMSSGALPAGLTLTPGFTLGVPNLVLSGTPTAEGQEEFTIKVTDNVLGTTFSQAYSINAKEPPRQLDSVLPGGTVGQFYFAILSVVGNPSNYTLKIPSPPPGLSVAYSGSTAIVSGKPTVAGSNLVAIEGTDQYGNTDIIAVDTVVIKPAPVVTFAVTSAPLAPTYNDAATVSFALTGSLPAVPTGSLSIALDGGAAKTYPVAAGAVTLPLGRQPSGTHTLAYSYSGDATYPALTSQTYGFSVAVPPYSVVGSQTYYHQAYTQYGNVAVDSKDNVYYVDFTCACIYKIDTQGNQTVFPSTGLNGTQGLRFDAADNLYLADTGNSRVLKITQAGVQTVLPFNSPGYPRYLAFDAGYQNLYVMDQFYGISIYNLASQTTTVYNNNISSPHGLAVDAQNNVYYGSLNTIVKNQAVIANLTQHANGLNFDRTGNLYIGADTALYRIDPAGNILQLTDTTSNEVALDSHGTLYYPTGADMLAYTPGPAVWGGRNEASAGGTPFQQGANYIRAFYSTPAGVTLSSVAIPAAGSPYSGETKPVCFTSTLCGATLYFGAFLPGPQPGYGVATFSDGTTTTTPLFGSGTQREMGFTPGNTTGTASGIANFGGAANDLNGGVYVSDSAANKVFKVAGGTLTPVPFTGLNAPTQLATDGVGSVYVLDSGTQRILKLDSGGNQTVAFDMSQQGSLLSSTLASLQSFAVDGATDLYLGGSSSSGAALIEFYGVNGASSIYATPPAVPTTLALDGFGTLYSTETQGALVKYDHFANRVPVATGLPVAASMAIEPSGAVYLANNTSPMLTQVSPTGTVAPYQVPGVQIASVVTIDNYGNLSVGDNSTQILTFNDRTTQAYTFGDIALGASSTLHHSVMNVGNQGGMTMSFAGHSSLIDPATTTCLANSTALDPGQSCEVGITYSTNRPGLFSDYVTVDAAIPQLYSAGTAAALTLTGNGATSIPVANPGGPYTGTVVSAINFTGLASADSTGEVLTYNWDFGDGTSGTGATPAHTYAAARTYIVKLTVTNTDGVAAYATTTAVIGQSYTASLTPASFDFGGVIINSLERGFNNSAVQAFTLTNTGTGSFSVGTVQLASEASNSYSASNNCTTLAVGAACTITVTFKPTVAGAISTTLSIKDAAGTQIASITGNGVTSPLAFSSFNGDFGTVPVGSQIVRTFTITNLVNQPTAYSLQPLSVSNPPYVAFSGCKSPIAANAMCTITITYQPTQVGPQEIVLSLSDPTFDTYLIFTSTGIAPLTISPPNFDFGNVSVGSHVSQTFTVANLANQPTAYSVQTTLPSSNPPVISVSGCKSPIAANATCTLTVNYQPTGTGPSTSTVSLSNAVVVGGITVGTGNPVVTSLTLTATGVAPTAVRSQVMIVGSNSSLVTRPTDGSTSPPSSTGGGTGAAIDSSGNLFSIDTTGSSITKFDDTGAVTGTLSGGGINKATALAVDGLGTVYVANGDGTISAFNSSSGAPISAVPILGADTSSHPAALNVDPSGSLWIANAGNNTVTEVVGVAAPAPTLVNGVVTAKPGTRP